ncbi:hypothetical protein EXM22_06095 [Oceanispirochaeta crateris]|uniref:Uncharacterized protein n=1 Tax=Oceanispirochaeta crateris TaxID=2518645 RepID=A0A5C1QJT0_9SPIO|nr:hypothetical protein [Oceanispirochaeta crateris]QEN07578.1 hypothetical protein EXM22_06095 [Oceanispirochaeta crateris]
MTKLKSIVLMVFFFCISISLSALEVKDHSSKIIFNEKDGVWSLFYNQDGRLRSFFEDRDNRTSYTDLVLDNRVYRLQKNSFFNQHIEEHSGFIVAHWSNNILHVTQSVQVDHGIKGFKITITVRNLSKNYISVGLKELLDTHNNTEGPDFMVEGNQPVDSEKRWIAAAIPAYWGTFPANDTGSRMTYTALGDRKPDQLIFANWKRLNDSDWDFNLREGRDFSLLPYSINDSAAAIYYNPVSIPPGTELSVQYALTAGGPVRDVLQSDSTLSADHAAQLPQNGKEMILNYALQYDLDLIDKLVDELNLLLLSDDPVYNSQTEYFEEELEKLKQKLFHYENLQ